jgi:hypothetical protein
MRGSLVSTNLAQRITHSKVMCSSYTGKKVGETTTTSSSMQVLVSGMYACS